MNFQISKSPNFPIKNCIVFLFLITFVNKSHAQKVEIGAGVGTMLYKGDISPSFNPIFSQFGGQFFFRYNLSNSVTFRAGALLGSISADDTKVDDPFNQARGYSFRTRIDELNLLTEYNFFNYKYNRYHKDWSPYVFGGVGFMKFSPKTDPAPSQALAPYNTNQVVFPYGAGIKYHLKGPWNLNLEFGSRYTLTDYLDNYGKDNPGATKLEQSDYTRNDIYYFVSVGLTYKFMRIVCP